MGVTGNQYAVIDADFYIKMTEYACDDSKLFLQLMRDLGVKPVMHEFVANVELNDNPYIIELLDSGAIEIRNYENYLKTDKDKQDYKAYFLDAYERMNCFDFPKGEDIYTYDTKDESLGEIRSIYMAKKLGYGYFMTDDGGAKRLAKSFLNNPIVLDVFQALIECKTKGTEITLKQLNPTITNVFRDRRDKLKILQNTYAEV